MVVGKRKREGQGTYLGPWLEQGGGGAGQPREQARWAERVRGGGAAAAREGASYGGGGRGAEERRWGPFIGRERRWGGLSAAVAAGERRGLH